MSDKGGNFFDGLLLGGLLGAVLALFYAPQSGNKTRDWVKQMREENQDLIDSTVETTENLINNTRSSIEQGLDKLSKTINKKAEELEE